MKTMTVGYTRLVYDPRTGEFFGIDTRTKERIDTQLLYSVYRDHLGPLKRSKDLLCPICKKNRPEEIVQGGPLPCTSCGKHLENARQESANDSADWADFHDDE